MRIPTWILAAYYVLRGWTVIYKAHLHLYHDQVFTYQDKALIIDSTLDFRTEDQLEAPA